MHVFNSVYEFLRQYLPNRFLLFEMKQIDNGNRVYFTGSPKGLKNNGNTCYLNSVLQALSSCPSIMTHLVMIKAHKNKGLFSGELHSTLLELREKAAIRPYSVNPGRLLKEIRDFNPNFEGIEQQDALELFQVMMEIIKRDTSLYDDTYNVQTLNIDRNNSESVLRRCHKGCLTLPVEGYMTSHLQCLDCMAAAHRLGHKAVNHQTFVSLSLPIPTGQTKRAVLNALSGDGSGRKARPGPPSTSISGGLSSLSRQLGSSGSTSDGLAGITLFDCMDELMQNEQLNGIRCNACDIRQAESIVHGDRIAKNIDLISIGQQEQQRMAVLKQQQQQRQQTCSPKEVASPILQLQPKSTAGLAIVSPMISPLSSQHKKLLKLQPTPRNNNVNTHGRNSGNSNHHNDDGSHSDTTPESMSPSETHSRDGSGAHCGIGGDSVENGSNSSSDSEDNSSPTSMQSVNSGATGKHQKQLLTSSVAAKTIQTSFASLQQQAQQNQAIKVKQYGHYNQPPREWNAKLSFHSENDCFIADIENDDIKVDLQLNHKSLFQQLFQVQRTYQQSTHDAIKHTALSRLPNILCFSFCRRMMNNDGSMRKVSSKVSFPVLLNMDRYTETPTGNGTLNESSTDNCSGDNNQFTVGSMLLKPSALASSLLHRNNHADNHSSKGFGSISRLTNNKNISTVTSATTAISRSILNRIRPSSMMRQKTTATAAENNVRANAADNKDYLLRAVIVHSGREDSGHYTAYCLLEEKPVRRWAYFSDEIVQYVEESVVLGSQAYMLFYDKIRSKQSSANLQGLRK